MDTKIVKCSGVKGNGSKCTREKDFNINEAPADWKCFQHKEIKKGNQGAGSKTPPHKVEQILADLQVYESMNYIAKRNKVAWNTVQRIYDEHSDRIEIYRDQKKKEFADRAWESIEKAMEIGKRKLDLTLERSHEIDNLVDRIMGMVADESVTFSEVKPVIKQLSSLADYSLRDISTFVGTLVDKHELVTGKATARNEVTGKDGEAIQIKTNIKKLSDEELENLEGIVTKMVSDENDK